MRGGWPSFGREENGESLGQLGGASLSNCRELRVEGESTPKLGATSQKTPLRVKLEFVSQGTNANEGGAAAFQVSHLSKALGCHAATAMTASNFLANS
jgi:hypothetical protein